MRDAGASITLVPMFSSTYAWVRSVQRIAGLPIARVEVAHDLDVALGHRRPQRGLVVQRGDAVAARR